MDLLLWSHAEAEDGEVDLRRQLTARGQKQARVMAKWIAAHQPKDLRIIVSPAVRTQQTAEALKLPFETLRKIGPEACVSELIAASGWPAASGSGLVIGLRLVAWLLYCWPGMSRNGRSRRALCGG